MLEMPGELMSREEKPEKESLFQRLRLWLLENELEVWHKGNPVTSMPILILILLLLLAAWAVIPIGLLSLILGCRFRFSGPDLDRDDLNRAVDGTADTAHDLGRHVVEELRRRHEKSSEDVGPSVDGENEVEHNE